MNTLMLNPQFWRLGTTILHALWKLAFLGLLAWGTLATLRPRRAQAQYFVACLFLGTMLAAPLITFGLLGPRPESAPVVVLAGGSATVPVEGAQGHTLRYLLDHAMELAPWLALLWSMGFALMLAPPSPSGRPPLVIGWMKPAILVPAAAMMHLRPEALEAVLAHEMAHVRRADYLANLLQNPPTPRPRGSRAR